MIANGPGFSVAGDLIAARGGAWGWIRDALPMPREDVLAHTVDGEGCVDVEPAWLDEAGTWRSPYHENPLTVVAWMPKPAILRAV